MIHLIYRSSATRLPSEDNLRDLLKQSRARNLRQNITGMLLYDNATYMQVLEGSEEDVHDIYNSILIDTRNNAHFKLIEEEISHRSFPDWTMGFKSIENLSPDELAGFQDIFDGKLDDELLLKNTSSALRLLMSFAKKAQQRVHSGVN